MNLESFFNLKPSTFQILKSIVEMSLLNPDESLKNASKDGLEHVRFFCADGKPGILIDDRVDKSNLAYEKAWLINQVDVKEGKIILQTMQEYGSERTELVLGKVPESYLGPVRQEHIKPFTFEDRHAYK